MKESFLLNRKFYFAVGVIVLSSVMCVTQHYEGNVFRDIILGVSGMFMGIQAWVDIKTQEKQGG